MRRLGLLALVALLSLPPLSSSSRAEENRRDDVDSTASNGPTPPAKTRPLLNVVALAIAAGRDININEDLAPLLGLRPDLRARELRVPAWSSPDHADHSFAVVYRPKHGDTIDPLGVLLDVQTTDLRDGMKWISRRTMLLSLSGALERAAAERGAFKDIQRSSMTVTSVQALSKDELSFFERATTGLPLEPAAQ